MQELLKNAWLGWKNYTDDGKLAALLFASLLFLWLCGKIRRQKAFFGYTVIMAAACVFPLSAAVLMVYQTKFYDYVWIWSLVPLTLAAAWGIAEFLGREKQEAPWKPAVLIAAVVLLCGNPGMGTLDFRLQKQERETVWQTVSAITENGQKQELCMLAPRKIMEYARAVDGSIRLVYGRNMWDKSLDGYSYDTYAEEIIQLYQWMCSLEELGGYEEQLASGMITAEAYEPLRQKCLDGAEIYIRTALEKGVSCLVLPGGLKEDVILELTRIFEEQAGSAEGSAVRTIQAAEAESCYVLEI